MSQLSYNHKNQKFKLMVEATTDRSIKTVYSSPFLVVFVFTWYFDVRNYQIRIRNEIPKDWYKDEGGKKNSILLQLELVVSDSLFVSVQDLTNRVVTYEVHRKRKITLQLTLLYDDYTVVHNMKEGGKSILCYNDQELQFNENVMFCLFRDWKGTCELNVRIESVSKNHNSKLFVICVQPNIIMYPQNADIAGGYTTPICVKSKRIAKSDSPHSLCSACRTVEYDF